MRAIVTEKHEVVIVVTAEANDLASLHQLQPKRNGQSAQSL
jgi:hypothetical protein